MHTHQRSSNPKGLASEGGGEGRASISLVNLSEPILCSIGRDPWCVVAAAGEHGPGDAGELIGERDRQQIAMRQAPGSLLDPMPQGRAWRSCRA